jgi:hypothetical protein
VVVELVLVLLLLLLTARGDRERCKKRKAQVERLQQRPNPKLCSGKPSMVKRTVPRASGRASADEDDGGR